MVMDKKGYKTIKLGTNLPYTSYEEQMMAALPYSTYLG